MDKYQEFYNDLVKLISDFKKAKEVYYFKYILIKMILIILSTLSTIFISLMFIDSLNEFFRIMSIVASGLASIFIAFDKIIDYRAKWSQRTITFVRLQKVKRLYKIYVLNNEDQSQKNMQFCKLMDLENEILAEDLSLWEEATKINE